MCAQSIAMERLDKPQSDRVDSEKEKQLTELKNRLSNNWVDLYKTNSEGSMLYRLLAPINFNSKKKSKCKNDVKWVGKGRGRLRPVQNDRTGFPEVLGPILAKKSWKIHGKTVFF